MIAPISKQPKPIQLDQKYELKCFTFNRDKFQIKVFDAQSRQKQDTVNVPIPEQYRRIATKFFSWVNAGSEIIMTGGQFVEDKTCSLDCYRIEVASGEMVDMN